MFTHLFKFLGANLKTPYNSSNIASLFLEVQMSKKLTGKIGYCDNKTLRLRDKSGNYLKGGHYVYIREDNRNGTCNVNVVTSLEERSGKYSLRKLKQVRNGNIYVIPKKDATFTRWSGVNCNAIKNIPVANILDIDKKKLRKRHRFFIGKFMK